MKMGAAVREWDGRRYGIDVKPEGYYSYLCDRAYELERDGILEYELGE